MNADPSGASAAQNRADLHAGGDAPAARALQLAWIIWVCLVLLSLAVMAIALFLVMNAPATAGSDVAASRWAWITGGFLILAVPAVFFWRSRQFRGYWRHQGVAPRTYLRGMSAVWIVLTIGALIGAAACIRSRTMFPNSAIAAVAVVTMMTLWPKGTAMTRPGGNPGDVGEYEEPR